VGLKGPDNHHPKRRLQPSRKHTKPISCMVPDDRERRWECREKTEVRFRFKRVFGRPGNRILKAYSANTSGYGPLVTDRFDRVLAHHRPTSPAYVWALSLMIASISARIRSGSWSLIVSIKERSGMRNPALKGRQDSSP